MSRDRNDIKETRMTNKYFYNIVYEFDESEIIYELFTQKKITREQQQNRIFNNIMDEYRKSRSMAMPQTTVNRNNSIGLNTYDQYRIKNITSLNIDTAYYYYEETENKISSKLSPIYIIIDERGRVITKGEEGSFFESYTYRYDSDNILEVRRSKEMKFSKDTLSSELRMKCFYSPNGYLDSILHYKEGIVNVKENFEYDFSLSNNDFLKVSINMFKRESTNIQEQNEVNITEIIFDNKLNWIQLIKSNGEVNRRISYK